MKSHYTCQYPVPAACTGAARVDCLLVRKRVPGVRRVQVEPGACGRLWDDDDNDDDDGACDWLTRQS